VRKLDSNATEIEENMKKLTIASVMVIHDGMVLSHKVVAGDDDESLQNAADGVFAQACHDVGVSLSGVELQDALHRGFMEWNDRLIILSWPDVLSREEATRCFRIPSSEKTIKDERLLWLRVGLAADYGKTDFGRSASAFQTMDDLLAHLNKFGLLEGAVYRFGDREFEIGTWPAGHVLEIYWGDTEQNFKSEISPGEFCALTHAAQLARDEACPKS